MNFEAPLVSILFGVFILAMVLWMWFLPEKADAALRAFPRMVWPARILVSVSMAWFAYNLNQVDVGRFNDLKVLLWGAAPLAAYLILRFIPDLLAVRGLCTFCLLAGQPVLKAVRWHGTPSQTAVALLVYVLMVKCMFLVVYPHFWIRGLNWLKSAPSRRNVGLIADSVVGWAMLIIGVISL